MEEVLYNVTLFFTGMIVGSLINTFINSKIKKDKKEIYNRGYEHGVRDGYINSKREGTDKQEVENIRSGFLKNKKLYRKILKKKGIKYQTTIAVEELSELAKELCKIVREKENMDNINEEMADVEIVLDELKLAFENVKEIRNKKEEKIKRLEERYENDDL